MPNLNKKEQVRRDVADYLAEAVTRSPEEYPITKVKLAKVAGTTRVTLDRHVTNDEILDAIDQQQQNGKLSPAARERRDLAGRIADANARAQAAEESYRRVVAVLNLVEANARLMGIDPERLYRPIPKPLRQSSNAGKRGKRAR